jgi:lysophospholipase L1-like esterase
MDSQGNSRGWSYYLAQSFEDPLVYVNFSRPGAQSVEVLDTQLPKALHYKPDIAAVIVGGNDLLRNGFSPESFYQNLRKIVSSLHELDVQILLLQLHDPTEILPLPQILARVLRRRVNAVNAATFAVAREFNAHVLHTRKIENIYERKVWHIDRMHPSKFGHQMIAFHFREILKKHWNISDIEIVQPEKKSRHESIKWMLRNGTPWFFKRSFDLFPAAIILMGIELGKLVFKRNSENSQLYFPNFPNHFEQEFQQVHEARVS